MNWLDITLLCLAAIGCIKGLFDGFIKQVVSLIALVVGIFFCGKVADWLRVYLVELGWFPQNSISVVSYVAGFILIVGLVLLVGEIFDRLVGATPLSIINHLAGGVIGIVLTLIFISLFLNGLNIIDKNSFIIKKETKATSIFYESVERIFPTIYPHNLFTRR